MIVSNFGVHWFPILKLIQIPVTILLAIGSFFLTRNGKLKRAFHLFFAINILFSILMFCLFYFNGNSILSSSVTEATLFNKIVSLTNYLWVGFSSAFMIVLIWGFANQHYTFKRAAYQYPLLAIIASLPITIPMSLMRFIIDKHLFNILHLASAVLFAIMYIIYIMLTYVKLNKKDALKNPSWKYLIALIALVLFLTVAKHLPSFPFKYFLKLKTPQVKDYLQIMGQFSFKQGLYNIFILMIGVLLGLWMYIKGSKLLAKIGGVLIIVITILGLYVFKMPMKAELLDIKNEYSLLPYGLFTSFVFLFLYLIKELCYFRFPLKNRFSAKLIVDLIFVSIAGPIFFNLPALAIVITGSQDASFNILIVGFFISMLICFIALYWINKEQKNPLIE